MSAPLEPVTVDKPWGREVWYSGIEARGESKVRSRDDEAVPLGRFLRNHGRSRPVTLLKTLHPDRGDLYLEVHEHKFEVYIVDTVDEAHWPDGGRMLLGARAAGPGADDAAFRDRLIAAARTAEGAGRIDAVQRFMNAVTLRPGDTVAIPPRVPHSLLQGVSVVEFQTPVFERKILAASQPVATQAGWDSAEAVELMDLRAQPAVTPARRVARQTLGTSAAFTVTRHLLARDEALPVGAWAIGWIVAGELRHDDRAFASRSAWIAPEAAEFRAAAATEVLVAREH